MTTKNAVCADANATTVGPDAPAAVVGPSRHLDQIDAAREVGGWLEAVALALPRIPNEAITTERADAGITVYWREDRPHAVALTIRDDRNMTFGLGFDAVRLAPHAGRNLAEAAQGMLDAFARGELTIGSRGGFKIAEGAAALQALQEALAGGSARGGTDEETARQTSVDGSA